MKKFRTIVSLIAMVLAGVVGFFSRLSIGKCFRRCNSLFADCRDRLCGLHGGQSERVITFKSA